MLPRIHNPQNRAPYKRRTTHTSPNLSTTGETNGPIMSYHSSQLANLIRGVGIIPEIVPGQLLFLGMPNRVARTTK